MAAKKNIELELEAADLSQLVTPHLVNRIATAVTEGGVLDCAIEAAARDLVVRMIYGLKIGKPSEYYETDRATWDEADREVPQVLPAATQEPEPLPKEPPPLSAEEARREPPVDVEES